MNAAGAKLVALAGPDDAQPEPKKGRRSLLPSSPPPPGTPRDQSAAWLTVAWGLGADAVDRAERYGRHEDARTVVILKSSQRITFERQGDAFDARRQERAVVCATGAQMPHYGPADAAAIAGVIVRLAETLAEDDSLAEASEWARGFLQEAKVNTFDVHGLGTPAGRYEALSVITNWVAPEESYLMRTPVARGACIVLDADTGTRWVRASHIAAHVRSEGTRTTWSNLRSRLAEVGWRDLGQVQQRQPGGHEKLKANVFEVPAGWDS